MAAVGTLCFAVDPSGTIPVLLINTENNAPIVSKEDYLNATCYLETNGAEGIEPLGSAEAPVVLTIKGRGNYTWTGFDKKPYKLKFDKKTEIMGMGKNKHFAILAHADDHLGFMRNITGFQLSRLMGLAYTPADAPVEVVLNGDYIGLYFLTETIRIDSNRVNITEQEDNATANVEGGWLVEIDNYDTDPHVSITEGNGERIIFTYKSPEVLSTEQEIYLKQQMEALNSAIYAKDKTDASALEAILDLDAAARFYIVQELMDDCESYHGSCYIYKDAGDGAKWEFGPVWDFGNSFQRGNKDKFIWQESAFNQTWIGELYKFPAFQEKVKEVWKDFCDNKLESLFGYMKDYAEDMSQAADSDKERWPDYGNSNVVAKAESAINFVKNSAKWLGKQWGYEPSFSQDPGEQVYVRGNFNNWSTSDPMVWKDSKWEMENISFTGDFKIASADWSTIDFGGETEEITPEAEKEYTLVATGRNLVMSSANSGKRMIFDPLTRKLFITSGSGIEEISGIGENEPEEIFTITGQRVDKIGESGIYIIRSDGKSRKVIR